MIEEEAISIVQRLLLGQDSIPVKVRAGVQYSDAEVYELKSALHVLIGLYRDKSFVPKVVALSFVNISAVLQSRFYDAAQQQRLEDLGADLEYLAEELFS